MKKELTIISDDLNHDIIDEKKARTLLLGLLGVVGSAFSDKQKTSLLYSIRQIIDHTKRTILIENSDLSDEDIINMIEEDFFGE